MIEVCAGVGIINGIGFSVSGPCWNASSSALRRAAVIKLSLELTSHAAQTQDLYLMLDCGPVFYYSSASLSNLTARVCRFVVKPCWMWWSRLEEKRTPFKATDNSCGQKNLAASASNLASSETNLNVACVICLEGAPLGKPAASAVLTQWCERQTWMYLEDM